MSTDAAVTPRGFECSECGAANRITERSLKQGDLVAALAKARPSFSKIKKDKKGTHGKYADLESILAAVQPALSGAELEVSFDSYYDGERAFKIARLDHSSDQWRTSRIEMEVEPPRMSRQGKEINNKMQMIGIASSYARRYVIMDLLAIAPDDADADRAWRQQRPAGDQKGGSPSLSAPPSPAKGIAQTTKKIVDKPQWFREQAAKGKWDQMVKALRKLAADADVAAPLIGDESNKEGRHNFYHHTARHRHDGAPGWTKETVLAQVASMFQGQEFITLPEVLLEPLTTYFCAVPIPATSAPMANGTTLDEIRTLCQALKITPKRALGGKFITFGAGKQPTTLIQLTQSQAESVREALQDNIAGEK